MPSLNNPRTWLQLVLWAVALHSIGVGVGLMLHPAGVLEAAGYHAVAEPFFPTQGGVFHLVVAVGYVMGAWNLRRNEALIRFAVAVKFMATVFLFAYWAYRPELLAVLASGVVDFLMGMAILLAYRRWQAADTG